MPIVMGIFAELVKSPVVVVSTLVANIVGRRVFVNRLPAILPAVIAGLIATALTSQFGELPSNPGLPVPTITMPVFTLNSLLTIIPIFVVLLTLQGNIPSMIYMRTQQFDPPERLINLISGVSTFSVSFAGPTGIALSLPLTAIVASESAGERNLRYRTIYFTAGAGILIALFASLAVALPALVPLPLLLSLAGLSLVDVFSNALHHLTNSPLKIGPIFTFVISLSGITFLEFGSFFRALVVVTAISFLLEGEVLAEIRQTR